MLVVVVPLEMLVVLVATFTVTVLADPLAAADLVFYVDLSNPINGVLATNPVGIGTIHV